MSEYIFEAFGIVEDLAKLHQREEIVRCRDCRHYTEDEMEYYQYCGVWCEQVEPNGFCSWGEKKVVE